MKIAKDSVARLAYKLRLDDGEIADESTADDPLVYLHGHGTLLPALEAKLEGLEAGQSATVVIEPEDGYGTHDPDLDLAIPLDAFPEEVRDQLEEGVAFSAEHPNDDEEEILYTVMEVRDGQVLATGNHPLADETLHFEITVEEVRPATAEELEHGHAHGAGGHHH